jgi:PEP-CTERM motif
MKRACLLCLVVLGLGIAASAQFVVYDNNLPGGWVTNALPGDPNPIFVLPSDLSGIGCGVENNTTCEPQGIFYVRTPWSGFPSYITMTDAGSTVPGDVINFDSGFNGWFRIGFCSDPDAENCLRPGYALYASYIEDPTTGFVSGAIPICCEVAGLSVILASDGEAPFDPFGFGFDTSDGIQFIGATYGGHTPEPGTIMLLGTGVLGMAGVLRRKLRM